MYNYVYNLKYCILKIQYNIKLKQNCINTDTIILK